jgi:hypothetical protein
MKDGEIQTLNVSDADYLLLPSCYHSARNRPDAAEQRRGDFLRKPPLTVRLCMVGMA